MATFKLIFPRLCSCGQEIGIYQPYFEGKNVTQTLNELKIVKMCCRRSIICAPYSIINSTNIGAYTDEVNITTRFGNSPNIQKTPIIKNSIPAEHDDFPNIPGETPKNPVTIQSGLPEVILPTLLTL